MREAGPLAQEEVSAWLRKLLVILIIIISYCSERCERLTIQGYYGVWKSASGDPDLFRETGHLLSGIRAVENKYWGKKGESGLKGVC